tara:strand:+ start:4162 stop:4707 length:546 start_codon:yes stop_codon:yes gene_type:complete
LGGDFLKIDEYTWTDGLTTREIKPGSCQAWVFTTGPDGIDQEGHQCSHQPTDGFPICHLHLEMFKRSRSPIHVEQFWHMDEGRINMIRSLIDGNQLRLFAPGYFRKRRRIRSWLTEIEIMIEENGQISLIGLTDRFNELYSTDFTTRQMAQGVKVVIDRGLVARSRKNVKSEKIVFYNWIT